MPIYRLGGTAVSGSIPYLLGIHDVNPLPPHLHCTKCQKVIWKDDYKDGFDIPSEVCPKCGGLMQGDGHNLVWQEYASHGRLPTYVFYLPCDMKPLISDWLDNHWLHHLIVLLILLPKKSVNPPVLIIHCIFMGLQVLERPTCYGPLEKYTKISIKQASISLQISL